MQNGKEPRITCVTGNPVTPLTANRFSPTGGITLPTSSVGWWGAFGVVLCQGCSIPFFYASLPRIGPEKAAMLNNLQPVTSVLMAYFLFAELLSSVQILGGAMVLGGILLMQWQDRRN